MTVDEVGRFSGGTVSCNGGKIHVYRFYSNCREEQILVCDQQRQPVVMAAPTVALMGVLSSVEGGRGADIGGGGGGADVFGGGIGGGGGGGGDSAGVAGVVVLDVDEGGAGVDGADKG
jgi:hypothetical protein